LVICTARIGATNPGPPHVNLNGWPGRFRDPRQAKSALFSHFEPLVTVALFSSPPAVLGAQLGLDLSIVSQFLAISTGTIIDAILHLTGNT
jgi:hypothetical protein